MFVQPILVVFVQQWCKGPETMREMLTVNAIIIEKGIFGVCSSLTKIRDPVIYRQLFCLTDPFLWNVCVFNPTSTPLILIVFWIWIYFVVF